MNNTTQKRPILINILLIWQIIEAVIIFFAIPLAFIFGILLTGDSYNIFNVVSSYVIPGIIVVLIIKLVTVIAMFKRKRWAAILNIIQNIVLGLLFLFLLLTIIFNDSDIDNNITVLEYLQLSLSMLFFTLLSFGFFNAAHSPYFKKDKPDSFQ